MNGAPATYVDFTYFMPVMMKIHSDGGEVHVGDPHFLDWANYCPFGNLTE
jgi:hypothetical protein